MWQWKKTCLSNLTKRDFAIKGLFNDVSHTFYYLLLPYFFYHYFIVLL